MGSGHNIVEIFLAAAAHYPDRDALVHDDATVTYGQLYERVLQTAGGLTAKGIGKGDCALVAVPMGIELYTVVLALFYIGAVPVFLDAWVGRARMAECLKTVPCKAVIAPRRLLWIAWLIRPLRLIPLKATPVALLHEPNSDTPSAVSGNDTALITFTTGSTGPPKAADRTHEFLYAQLAALRPLLHDDCIITSTTLPIVVLLHLALGKTTVLPPRRYKATKPKSRRCLHRALLEHSVQSLVVSPSIIESLLQLELLPDVRKIFTGGGPVFPSLAYCMIRAYPAANITAVFGSTEAEPVSHINGHALAAIPVDTLLEKGLPVGLPDASADVRIIRWKEGPVSVPDKAALDAMTLPAGAWGEIVVAGEHVLRHYVNNAAAEALTKLRIGEKIWHRTGDAGRVDTRGNLFFLGRGNEVIFHAGQYLFPAMLAYAIAARAGAQTVAIIETRHGITLVAERGTVSLGVLQNTCAVMNLPVAAYRFVRKIPRDPRHQTKVDTAALRKMIG